MNFGHFLYSTSDGPDSSFADDFLEEEPSSSASSSPSPSLIALFDESVRVVHKSRSCCCETLSFCEQDERRREKRMCVLCVWIIWKNKAKFVVKSRQKILNWRTFLTTKGRHLHNEGSPLSPFPVREESGGGVFESRGRAAVIVVVVIINETLLSEEFYRKNGHLRVVAGVVFIFREIQRRRIRS